MVRGVRFLFGSAAIRTFWKRRTQVEVRRQWLVDLSRPCHGWGRRDGKRHKKARRNTRNATRSLFIMPLNEAVEVAFQDSLLSSSLRAPIKPTRIPRAFKAEVARELIIKRAITPRQGIIPSTTYCHGAASFNE